MNSNQVTPQTAGLKSAEVKAGTSAAAGYAAPLSVKDRRAVNEPEKEQQVVLEGAASINEDLKSLAIPLSLSVSMDHETNRIVVKVIDRETGDLVRQIPSEEFLAMVRAQDEFRGKIFNRAA